MYVAHPKHRGVNRITSSANHGVVAAVGPLAAMVAAAGPLVAMVAVVGPLVAMVAAVGPHIDKYARGVVGPRMARQPQCEVGLGPRYGPSFALWSLLPRPPTQRSTVSSQPRVRLSQPITMRSALQRRSTVVVVAFPSQSRCVLHCRGDRQ